MKKVAKAVLLTTIFTFVASGLYAQNQKPENGAWGLTASIQGSQTNLQVPIWVTDDIVIAPVFGLNHQDNTFTRINLGVTPRFYQDMGSNFASYIGARVLLQRTSPDVGPDDNDFLLGATGGGEYFLSQHFSLGVEGQLNFLFNDNGNNGISTGAAIQGTYYF